MSDLLPTDIVVTGTRIDPTISFGSFYNLWRTLPEDQRSATWTYGPYATLIDDQTTGLNPRDRLTLDVAISDFLDAIGNLNAVLDGLPAGTIIKVSSTTSVSVEQFRQKLKSIEKFVVTSKTYPAGYGGVNLKNKIEIRWNVLRGYTLRGRPGAMFLLIHEIAHNTEAGGAARDKNFTAHLKAGGTKESYDSSSPFFIRQEAMTNSIAKNMAAALGVDIDGNINGSTDFPTYGFYVGSDL